MAIPFSDTTNRNGLIQMIEDRTNTNSATASSYSLATKTRDINSAFARFSMIAVDSSGRWQFDDTNQEDYPFVLFDLNSGTTNYSFNYDGSTVPNQILDIHRVEILDRNGQWKLLKPMDESDIETEALPELQQTLGEPEWYDKTANAIWLYPPSDYNWREAQEGQSGIKLYTSRTPSYFTTADTTKKAGIPDIFHEYLALRPSYFYCLQKGLPQAKALGVEVMQMEEQIKEYYGSRQRDEREVMSVNNSYAIDTGSWGRFNRGGNMRDYR